MPSAFSRFVSEVTMVTLEQLIKQMSKDLEKAPTRLKAVIKDAQTSVERAKQLYVSEVLDNDKE